MTDTESIEAWHWLPDNGKTAHSERVVRPGQTIKLKGKIVCCSWGLHASERAIDAIKYAPGAMISRVVLSVDIKRDHGGDKLCARRRKTIWMADATKTLHEFAVWCAREALSKIKDPDPRSLAALDAKLAWLRGDIGDDDLLIARLDAESAAWSAALQVAWSAALQVAWSAAWLSAWWAAGSAQNAELERRLYLLQPKANQ